jgi:hypothetical protein
LGAGFHPQLAVDVAGVGFDRSETYAQFYADLLVGVGFEQQFQHHFFPRR